MMAENAMDYGYSVRTDGRIPILIRYRYGAVETFDPSEPGEWRRSPLKDSLLYGGGDFVWYDDVPDSEVDFWKDKITKASKKE